MTLHAQAETKIGIGDVRQVRDLIVMRKPFAEGELRQGLAAGELVHLAPDERVRQGRVPAHDRLGE